MWRILLSTAIAAGFVSTPAQSAPLTFSGSVTNYDALVNDYWGTTGNPAMGFDLYAKGPITYDYSFTFDAGLSPAFSFSNQSISFNPGKTITLSPYFSLQSATVTATQNLKYGTDFSLTVDLPALSPKTVSFGFGNMEMGDVNLNLTGRNGDFSSFGNSIVEGMNGVSAETVASPAWGVGVDLISVASHLPVVGTVFGVLDGVGMDLTVGMGLDVLRSDYFFMNPQLESYDLQVPDLAEGSSFHFEQPDDLAFELQARSFFGYQGAFRVALDLLDGWWVGTDPKVLWDIPAGTSWSVGAEEMSWSTTEFVTLLSDEFTVGQSLQLFPRRSCCDSFEFNRWPRLPENNQVLDMPVPEPSSLLLAGIALAGLAAAQRRRV